MQFDGSEVLVGDVVYDVVNGSGSVTKVDEAKAEITVQFSNFRTPRVFDATGARDKMRKTLYWHPPIMAIPPKEAHNWSIARAAAGAAANAVLGLV